MDEPPEDELAKACWESLMSYTYRQKKMRSVNGALSIIYGMMVANGRGDHQDIVDTIKDMQEGL